MLAAAPESRYGAAAGGSTGLIFDSPGCFGVVLAVADRSVRPTWVSVGLAFSGEWPASTLVGASSRELAK